MGRSAIRQNLGTASFYINTDYSLKMLDFGDGNVKSGLNFSEFPLSFAEFLHFQESFQVNKTFLYSYYSPTCL